MDYVGFSSTHLPGVLSLCEAEGWRSFPDDPERATRALTAPGVVTVVAVQDGEVVGFVQALTDGELQSYVCQIVVASEARGRGFGRGLVDEAFKRSGARRVDLMSLARSEGFYESFPHRRMAGYRIYPDL